MATVLDFIQQDLPQSFAVGWMAGFLIASTAYAIRACVKLFIRTVHGRS